MSKVSFELAITLHNSKLYTFHPNKTAARRELARYRTECRNKGLSVSHWYASIKEDDPNGHFSEYTTDEKGKIEEL